MKKKLLLRGPINSSSGYGEMCRLALTALRKQEELYDLYLEPTNWGNCGWLFKETEEKKIIDSYIEKTIKVAESGQPLQFDVSLQITIPNEWKKIATYNIGYTAGIETTHISPAWVEPSFMMDKIIVISEHAKKAFDDTEFTNNQTGQKVKVSTPVEVCYFPVEEKEMQSIDLELKSEFNFLAVCQWGPRKNLEQTIVNFVEEFHNESNVGLVLKINASNDSNIDKAEIQKRLTTLLGNFPNKKCHIYLIHGHLSDEQMTWLYRHPKIKAIVSTSHGEGYGLPLFEAAYNELPVIAPDWSAPVEFLTMKDEDGVEKKMFGKIACDIRQVMDHHVWKGVLEKESNWAYPIASSYKERLREMYKDHARFKSWAKKLNVWIQKEFNKDKIHNRFLDCVKIEENNTTIL